MALEHFCVHRGDFGISRRNVDGEEESDSICKSQVLSSRSMNSYLRCQEDIVDCTMSGRALHIERAWSPSSVFQMIACRILALTAYSGVDCVAETES